MSVVPIKTADLPSRRAQPARPAAAGQAMSAGWWILPAAVAGLGFWGGVIYLLVAL
ncbi:hypothetical protein [Phaeovulum vinaykumarii]|uniref:Uncharacterized protein n=1 Tax=Phaeovulum vinaykumarii TaxID=407234 RepID=A0A1N7MNG0_9RHOB|nr:hypothetical protein [Phaeovulum vinaykumarii]SIS87675.1 hypothetical protein SAMN05421795_108134 [Phaeovulum vinaykumarii]SOC13012.1 hypothetical protein SAMN05878426_10812 [Phaeovulum vinaykumarii]